MQIQLVIDINFKYLTSIKYILQVNKLSNLNYVG